MNKNMLISPSTIYRSMFQVSNFKIVSKVAKGCSLLASALPKLPLTVKPMPWIGRESGYIISSIESNHDSKNEDSPKGSDLEISFHGLYVDHLHLAIDQFSLIMIFV